MSWLVLKLVPEAIRDGSSVRSPSVWSYSLLNWLKLRSKTAVSAFSTFNFCFSSKNTSSVMSFNFSNSEFEYSTRRELIRSAIEGSKFNFSAYLNTV